MKLKSIPLLLLLPALMVMLVGCSGDGQPLPAATPASTQVLPTATPIPTPVATQVQPTPTATPTQVPPKPTAQVLPTASAKEGQEAVFWNAPYYSDMPNCTADFRFTHRLVDPEDIAQTMFGTGSHISLLTTTWSIGVYGH